MKQKKGVRWKGEVNELIWRRLEMIPSVQEVCVCTGKECFLLLGLTIEKSGRPSL